jgi:hypothetical protein
MKALIAGAIAVLALLVWFARAPSAQPGAIDPNAFTAAAPTPLDADRVGEALAPQPLAARAVSAASPPPTLAARIERLRAGADARDAYRAYRLIAGCLRAREFDAHVAALPMTLEFAAERAAGTRSAQRVSEACQDISPLQMAQRVSLVERAARAGVPGAAAAWTTEGPFGDKTALMQRPDDPLVVEWANQAIEMIKAATKQNDVEAIGQFGLLCMNWELDEVDKLKVVLHDADERELRARVERN